MLDKRFRKSKARRHSPPRHREIGPQAPDLYAAFIPAPEDSHRFLTPAPPSLPPPIQPEKANSMFDTLMLVAGVAAFALFLGYSALCVNL
jgi:hypothetical protein